MLTQQFRPMEEYRHDQTADADDGEDPKAVQIK